MDLTSILENVINAKRIYRDTAAAQILRNPELLPELIDKVYDVDDPLHIKAAWVLELVYLQDHSILDPYLHEFISRMPLLKHESALRPVSKICSLWSKYYFSQTPSKIKLSQEEVEIIISCNFDWLIEEHKVATQVFAMDTLKSLDCATKLDTTGTKIYTTEKRELWNKRVQGTCKEIIKKSLEPWCIKTSNKLFLQLTKT